MEKILVVYYSLEGNTKLIAENVARAINADVMRLSPVKDLHAKGGAKFFWGGKQVLMHQKPKLKPLDKDPLNYDVIFIGTPVWASTFAPAIRSFFASVKIQGKKVAFFCTSGSGNTKTLANLKKMLSPGGNQILGGIELQEPLTHNIEKAVNQAVEWATKLVPLLIAQQN